MSTLDIHEQTPLGSGRLVNLTATGIRYRLFRSVVSIIVIAVAVAFFMNVLSASLVRSNLLRTASRRVHELRRAAQWATRLSQAGTQADIIGELDAAEPGGPAWEELQRFGGFTDERMREAAGTAARAAAYMQYLGALDYGSRRALVRDAEGTQIFDRLQGEEEWRRFRMTFESLPLSPLPDSLEGFRAFLDRWPGLRTALEAVLAGRQEAVDAVQQAVGDQPMGQRLADAAGAFGETIREAGFHFSPETAKVVADQAESMLASRRLEESLQAADVSAALAARLNKLPDALNSKVLWDFLAGERRAEWYLGVLEREGVEAPDWPPARVSELARLKQEQRVLRQAERLEMGSRGGFLGLGRRMGWLLIISMLVCVVGITNAMLMAVTERFREIATLKCLGALDGSIMGMFVLEACLLGLVGGLIGGIGGGLIGFLRMLGAFGAFALTAIPGTDLLLAYAGGVVLGVVLAGAAAIFPSYQAARLPPMEAMRIE